MQRGSQPVTWRPKGVSDTIESTTAFNGAMASLSNLIPDPTTAQLWQCRPAATVKASFGGGSGGPFSSGFSSGFAMGTASTAGQVSVFKIVGNLLYGMVASLTDGNDHPFCFNLTTNAFINVGGATAGTLPQTLPTTGAWTPPIMDLIGSKLIVTHPGFSNTAFFFGWFDVSNPTSPVWHAGNLTGAIQFTIPPIAVAQFFGRAYYIVNVAAQPAVIFSDVLNPINVTNATQVLTFGDNAPLSCFGQLRLYNQLGGIVQALVVFKGVANMYQITGDAALNNLSINAMNLATGTLAPNTVCSTPKGLAFVSPEGLRIISFQSDISDPIGYDGQGVAVPFIYSNVPSRMCAACNGNVIRISTQNANAGGTPFQEWWYDIARKIWSGPHTFPASYIETWSNTFIMAAVGVPSLLFQSDIAQNAGSVFVENGLQLNWIHATAYLPDTDQMANVSVSYSLLDAALSPTAPPIVVTAQNADKQVIDTVNLVGVGAGAFWGQFNWGQAQWGTGQNALAPRQLQWHQPLVFIRALFTASGQSAAAVRVGAWHFRYKVLKYLANIGAAA